MKILFKSRVKEWKLDRVLKARIIRTPYKPNLITVWKL